MKKNHKKFSSQEELEIIRSGDEKKIKAMLRYPLHSASEVELVKTGNADLIKKYIKRYKFSLSAELALLKTGDEELIIFYLNEWLLKETSQLWLLQHNIELFKKVMNKTVFGGKANLALIEKRDTELIHAYIKKHWLHEDAQLKLVQYGYLDLVRYFISRGNSLCFGALNYIIEKAKLGCKQYISLLRYYIRKRYGLRAGAEKEIMCSDNLRDVAKEYIRHQTLYDSTLDMLIERDDAELLKLCAKSYSFSHGQLLTLLNNGRIDIVKTYLETHL